jgi:PAS domain S-box-containing protein
MIFRKKKFYSLSDIKNQIAYSPLLFVVLLSFVSFIIVYVFLNYQENTRVKILVQSDTFKQKNMLRNYIGNIKYNTSANLDDIEVDLSNRIYEVNGYIKSSQFNNEKFNVQHLKSYLKEIEETTKINFVLFNTNTYDMLYGKSIIDHLSRLTNSKIKTASFRKHMLRNIKYIGDDNLMYWIDNSKRNIQLSYFKLIESKDLFIGAFSRVDDMKRLTKKAILDSMFAKSKTLKNAYFIFYDEKENAVYNYYGKSEKLSVEDMKTFTIPKDDNLIYDFSKYQYKIFVHSTLLKDEVTKIKADYEYKLIIGSFTIIFIALLLILVSNIFGKFITTIFNRYNQRLERRNILFKKWKDRYGLAIIASNDGLWDIDLDTYEIFFSKKWLEMFEYERDDIQTFDDWMNLIHHDDKDNVLKQFNLHLASKTEHFVCEYRLKTKSNNYKWVLVRGKAFLSDTSNRMLMMSMDIDNRIKLTKEVRDVELLTEFGRIVMFRWLNDENLSVKFVSKSINTYGYEAAQFDNEMTFFKFIHKDDIKALKDLISRAISNDASSFTNIHRVIHSDQNIKWVYNRTILIKDDHGKVKGLFGYLNDITEMKLNEEELKQKIELEVKRNIKTDRILVQQNKLASMGEMLGNIAHQWSQPLNNINLLLYFIRDNHKNFSELELEDSISSAKLQIDYMSQTIDDFRNFYQPTKEKMYFDIKKSIIQSAKIVESLFERAGIMLNVTGENIKIDNYENEFAQVVVNILNNACDAKIIKSKTVNFKAEVTIEIRKVDEDIIISISNNCGQVKKEILEKMFEPYFTTKFENQGTGIGLYMAKVIIEKNMHGRIEASNNNDGIDFIITFKA